MVMVQDVWDGRARAAGRSLAQVYRQGQAREAAVRPFRVVGLVELRLLSVGCVMLLVAD